MRPEARGMAQHGVPPGWLEESDPAGCDFVRDGLSMPRLPWPHHLSGDDLFLNVHKTPSWAMSRMAMAWYSSRPMPSLCFTQRGYIQWREGEEDQDQVGKLAEKGWRGLGFERKERWRRKLLCSSPPPQRPNSWTKSRQKSSEFSLLHSHLYNFAWDYNFLISRILLQFLHLSTP